MPWAEMLNAFGVRKHNAPRGSHAIHFQHLHNVGQRGSDRVRLLLLPSLARFEVARCCKHSATERTEVTERMAFLSPKPSVLHQWDRESGRLGFGLSALSVCSVASSPKFLASWGPCRQIGLRFKCANNTAQLQNSRVGLVCEPHATQKLSLEIRPVLRAQSRVADSD